MLNPILIKTGTLIRFSIFYLNFYSIRLLPFGQTDPRHNLISFFFCVFSFYSFSFLGALVSLTQLKGKKNSQIKKKREKWINYWHGWCEGIRRLIRDHSQRQPVIRPLLDWWLIGTYLFLVFTKIVEILFISVFCKAAKFQWAEKFFLSFWVYLRIIRKEWNISVN